MWHADKRFLANLVFSFLIRCTYFKLPLISSRSLIISESEVFEDNPLVRVGCVGRSLWGHTSKIELKKRIIIICPEGLSLASPICFIILTAVY